MQVSAIHETFADRIKVSDLSGLNLPQSRTLLRRTGVAYGKGVSMLRGAELTSLLETGKVPSRLDGLLMTGSSGRRVRKPKAPKTSPATTPKTSPVATKDAPKPLPVAPSASHAVTFAQDGLTVCQADRECFAAAAKGPDWAWFPKSATDLHAKLNGVGYVIGLSEAQIVYSWLTDDELGVATLACDGVAGTGKSYLAKKIADLMLVDRGAFVVDAMHPGTRPEELLANLVPDARTPSGVQKFRGKVARAAMASHYGKVILFVEEYEKSKTSVDHALLQFLQDGRWDSGEARVVANLDNLKIIFAKNDTRDLQVPLVRRIQFMPFRHPAPALVMQMLAGMLPKRLHNQIAWLATIYVQTVSAMKTSGGSIDRAATVQELAKLVLAIDRVGKDEADVNALIRSIVTKDDITHRAFVQASRRALDARAIAGLFAPDVTEVYTNTSVSVKTLGEAATTIESLSGNSLTKLPRGKNFSRTASSKPEAGMTGVAALSDDVYDALAKLFNKPGDAGMIGSWEVRENGTLTLHKPIDVTKRTHYAALATLQTHKLEGEIHCRMPDATVGVFRHMLDCAESKGMGKRTSMERDNLVFYYHANDAEWADVRWSPDGGIDVILPLASAHKTLSVLMGHSTPNVVCTAKASQTDWSDYVSMLPATN